MNKIFVCSPLRGAYEINLMKAKEYCRRVALEGYIPIAPHCYFTGFLDEFNSQERELGIKMGLKLLEECDSVRVYGDRISEGMKAEIKAAKELGIPVIFTSDYLEQCWKEINDNSKTN